MAIITHSSVINGTNSLIRHFILILRLDLSSCGFWMIACQNETEGNKVVQYMRGPVGQLKFKRGLACLLHSRPTLADSWNRNLHVGNGLSNSSSRRDLIKLTVVNHGMDSWSRHSSSRPNDVTIVQSYSACRIIFPAVLSNVVKPTFSLLDSKGQRLHFAHRLTELLHSRLIIISIFSVLAIRLWNSFFCF